MSTSLPKLQKLLQKLFRADAADLNFGIYRIINSQRIRKRHLREKNTMLYQK